MDEPERVMSQAEYEVLLERHRPERERRKAEWLAALAEIQTRREANRPPDYSQYQNELYDADTMWEIWWTADHLNKINKPANWEAMSKAEHYAWIGLRLPPRLEQPEDQHEEQP